MHTNTTAKSARATALRRVFSVLLLTIQFLLFPMCRHYTCVNTDNKYMVLLQLFW